MHRFELAHPGPLRDQLVERVLQGEKTATSCTLEDWLSENQPPPKVGERQTLIDSTDRVVGVIEFTAIERYKLNQVPLEVIRAEGEGFEDTESWRRSHEEFWLGDAYDQSGNGWQLPDNTEVIVERFRLVEDNE